jgi:hypothetical protein
VHSGPSGLAMQCLSFMHAPPFGTTHCCLPTSFLVSHTAPVSAVQSSSVVHGITAANRRDDGATHIDSCQPGSLLIKASVHVYSVQCRCT